MQFHSAYLHTHNHHPHGKIAPSFRFKWDKMMDAHFLGEQDNHIPVTSQLIPLHPEGSQRPRDPDNAALYINLTINDTPFLTLKYRIGEHISLYNMHEHIDSQSCARFCTDDVLDRAVYISYPFPHTIIDQFVNDDKKIRALCASANQLCDTDAQDAVLQHKHKHGHFTFPINYVAEKATAIQALAEELYSQPFIKHVERLTGTHRLAPPPPDAEGASMVRIKAGGFEHIHREHRAATDDTNKSSFCKSIRLLLYLNPGWKDEFGGQLCIYDHNNRLCPTKVTPLLNRCVIYDAANHAYQGHPVPVNTPGNEAMNVLSIQYYQERNTDVRTRSDSGDVWLPQADIHRKCNLFFV